MKEKELRLALVCYGGVSLTVYMHGLTKEIWKLQRASKARRDLLGRAGAEAESGFSDVERSGRPADTEAIYFDLLGLIGETIELRVLVDIIAGASAGGINGIFLAKAIAEDLSLEPLTDLWLKNADVERLLDPSGASGRWSKLYLRPLVWLFGRWQARRVDELVGREASPEVRRKLSRFIRSRWFEPPFSGQGFATLLYDGLMAMEDSRSGTDSLLPPGYPLDLMVTVTDFHGHSEKLRLHSPPEIDEREHRLVISFHDSGLGLNGTRRLADLPSLAFAARATASFPGAFPPAQIGEIDRLVATKGHNWLDRMTFIDQLFPGWASNGRDPRVAALIDGSVLNNKPFGAAIAALRDRPAHREVDRRIVYIEPNPKPPRGHEDEQVPGFFSAIIGSLSSIPRQQPIRDELEWLQDLSQRLALSRGVIASVAPDVEQAVEEGLGAHLDMSQLSPDALAQWRDIAQQQAARGAGFAYKAYAELKLTRVLSDLAEQLGLFQSNAGPSERQDLQRLVMDWAARGGITPIPRIEDTRLLGEHLPWVQFLRSYDLGFRIRRLRFVIRRLNQLYGATRLLDHAELDDAKALLYSALAPFIKRRNRDFFHADCMARCARARGNIDDAIAGLGEAMDLTEVDDTVDALVAQSLGCIKDGGIARALLMAYVGFPFFDIVALPMLDPTIDELDAVKVDRLSPSDATTLRRGGAAATLKGIEFATFGAFLSRAYRENDYLWGRLHAVERLIDIVLSSVSGAVTIPADRIAALKQRAFRAVLESERPRLPRVTALIDQLLASLDAPPSPAGD